MSQREAFEAWKNEQTNALDRLGTYIGDPAEIWQAAIQHARDVAVKACEGEKVEGAILEGEVDEGDVAYNNACGHCADAIKEALK